MREKKLGSVEARFADLIWENEPLSSGQLVQLAGQALGWKKSTVYTVLKRLCNRGLFENEGGTVRACIPRAAFYAMQSQQFVDETFDGSLPAFVAAFSSRRSLSATELDELQQLIEEMRRLDD